MEILDRPFGTITMDFITNLPKSNRFDLLHMVTDRFHLENPPLVLDLNYT